MKQEIVPQDQPGGPQQKKKTKRGGTTYAGKVNDWQRILASVAANGTDLAHLAVPQAQLTALLTQVRELKEQQAASRAVKETASLQLQDAIAQGQRLAALMRQAVKQHYGPRSPKLTEFDVQPFRGRAKSVTTPTPTPTPEVAALGTTSSGPPAAVKASADPANHS